MERRETSNGLTFWVVAGRVPRSTVIIVLLLMVVAAGAGRSFVFGRTAVDAGPGCVGSSALHGACGGVDSVSAIRAQLATPTWINVTLSSTQAPPLDFWASLAYDLADHNLVLFGGCGRGHCPAPAQTWIFSHGSWSNVTNESVQPPSRSYGMLDYDSADGYVLLFGGVGPSSVLGDTWEFTAGRWTNLTASLAESPPARWAGSLAYDPIDRGLLLFGGMSAQGTRLNDTWIYSGGSWRNLQTPVAPPGRYEGSMAWDVVESEGVLVDGCGTTSCPLNDSWRFQNDAWSRLPQAPGRTPEARELAGLTYDASAAAIRLFGGIGNGTSLGDTWEYASGAWTRIALPSSPRAREGSAVEESTMAWSPDGTPALWPFEVLWGGDWVACPTCALQGLEDTWVLESPPQATLAAPASPVAMGTPAVFQGFGSGGTLPLSYAWRFGDGGVGTGSNLTHVYGAAGRYTVSLVVTDDAGATATNSSVVTVAAAPVPLATAAGIAIVVALALVAAVVWIRRRRHPPPT